MNKFMEGFMKKASFRKALVKKLMHSQNMTHEALHKLMQGKPVKFKGISTKSIRRTSAGRKL